MIEARALSFSYAPEQPPALRDLSFTVAPGELVAIIGQNGSGKSTLARLLTALLLPSAGELRVDGIVASAATSWEIRRRVGLVFQRPDDQLIANTVRDDVAFGPENLGLPRDELVQRVQQSLAALDLVALAERPIAELSGSDKQRVALAGIIAMQPAYLVLDEPTALLAPPQARRLLTLVDELRQRLGLAVVYITHFMHEVVRCDRVLVLDGGQLQLEGSPRAVFAQAAKLRGLGLDLPPATVLGQRLRARGLPLPEVLLSADALATALAPYAQPAPVQPAEIEEAPPPAAPRPPLIAVRDLHFSYLAGTPLAQVALRGVSCDLFAGETLALLGGPQAGKSTLVEFFNGLRLPPPGHVSVAGQDIAGPRFDLARLRREVGIVFQQPETQLLEDTVGKDVSFSPRQRGLPPAESRALVAQALTAVGLDYEAFRLRYIHSLSGGQKRRVAIAGVLAAQPKVLILDEPLAGLDPRGRAELADLLRELPQRLGITLVLVGNTIDELAELADRVIVLQQGQLRFKGSLPSLLARVDEFADFELEPGQAAQIALALRDSFPDLPTSVLDLDALEEALIARLRLLAGA